MATIFLTGGTGSIGKVVLPMLAKSHKIRALAYSKQGPQMKNVEWVRGNITRVESILPYLKGCDILIHMAADVSNQSTQLNAVNVDATTKLVLAAHQAGVKKLIIFSSASVTKKFLTPYSRSKVEMEIALKKINIPMMILRPSLVYHKKSTNLIGMRRLMTLPFPFIPLPDGDLADLRPIHSEDVGTALIRILEKPFPKGFVQYDLSSDEKFTLEDAIRLMAEKEGVAKPIINVHHTWFGHLGEMFEGTKYGKYVLQIGVLGESYRVKPEKFTKIYGSFVRDPKKGIRDSL
jgi:nucleoside-diphosphate-sugar epimerase